MDACRRQGCARWARGFCRGRATNAGVRLYSFQFTFGVFGVFLLKIRHLVEVFQSGLCFGGVVCEPLRVLPCPPFIPDITVSTVSFRDDRDGRLPAVLVSSRNRHLCVCSALYCLAFR